ncbi:hypothetical protein F0562_009943 [Nyssa sinensis]|uniref:Fe-S metabolism associated domain-containing protein n=1 Tax=Nyssa sinensis TaxID=561372 RepID=A0A5J4ZZ50_9ASTE|nr:hypothetical protein F0562_009943 [Nyssa sinensis]
MSISTSFRLFSTKFPQSLLHPNTPIFKTLILSTPLLPPKVSFFKSISIQRIPTKPPSSLPSSSSTSVSLQPIEELPPKLQEIVKLFQAVQQPKAKYEQLLFYGRNLTPLDAQFKTSENKVQGCVSQVWVRAYLDSDKNVVFEADSDSVLTKGLAALLVQGLSGRPKPEKGGEVSSSGGENPVESSNSGSKIDSGIGESKKGESSEIGIKNSRSNSDGGVVLGSRGERIKQRLERELQPIELQVEDISYQHAGHAAVGESNGETHFNVKVVSKEFEGKSLVKRHRKIYDLLQDELQSGLHALSIVAKTPSEVDSR